MGAEATARSRREALSMGVTPDVAEQKQELKGGVGTREFLDVHALILYCCSADRLDVQFVAM